MRQHALPDRQHDLAALAGFLTLCLAVGGLAGWATSTTVDGWYRTLVRPSFTPPACGRGAGRRAPPHPAPGRAPPARPPSPPPPPLPLPAGLDGPLPTHGHRQLADLAPARDPGRQRALALFGVQLFLNLIWSFL